MAEVSRAALGTGSRQYLVYVMANRGRTIYIGVTNNLVFRVQQHRSGVGSRFTSRCRLTDLVYLEATDSVEPAIQREKHIKGWKRSRKVALIERTNPEWDDLSAAIGVPPDPSLRSG